MYDFINSRTYFVIRLDKAKLKKAEIKNEIIKLNIQNKELLLQKIELEQM